MKLKGFANLFVSEFCLVNVGKRAREGREAEGRKLVGSGVLIYKSVTDRLVTRGQPGETNFMGRTTFICSNFVHLPLF